MAVEFVSSPDNPHPITELDYETVTQSVDVGGRSLQLTTLANVEKAIDLVFHWLESKGRDASEIERLAPYFGVVWPSALALCGYLLQERIYHHLQGRSLIELGCGLALPSLVAAQAGANCTATDHHPDVPRFLRRNVAQNEPCHLRYRNFPSEKDWQFSVELGSSFDLVIASDVLYERQLVETFAENATFFASDNATCIIADPGRPYIQEFVNAMKRRGWRDHLEPWTVPHQGQQRDIYMMVFTR